ncbi:hypothetical protein V8E53_005313 [Lactarius tabidus]
MAESSVLQTASPDIIRFCRCDQFLPRCIQLFGPLCNWALYGILCVQIYVYSYNFPQDSRPIKFLAYFVFLLETAQTALTGADIYYWFVAGFGDVDRLRKSHYGPIDAPIITGVISLIVQEYFCYRIWVLNRGSSYICKTRTPPVLQMWICSIIAVSAVTQSSAQLWSSIKPLVDGDIKITKAIIYTWAISCSLADILIAVAMVLLLRRAIGNFSSFVLVRVVRLVVETNALTATLAIATLVLYVTFPNELYFIFTVEIIGKVYSNTLLMNLNNRIYLRDHRLPEYGNSGSPPSAVGARPSTMPPLEIALPEPQLRAIINHSFPRFIISGSVDLDNGRGDDTSSLRDPKECHPLPEDPEWTVGMSLRPFDRKDEVNLIQ